MPVSVGKRAALDERRRLVRALWDLGLSHSQIAQLLEIESHHVTNDVRVMELSASQRVRNDDETLFDVLDSVASFILEQYKDDGLRRALDRHPQVIELGQFMRGVVGAHLMQRRVIFSAAFPECEARLIAKLWGEDSHIDASLTDKQLQTDVDSCWRAFLGRVRMCGVGVSMDVLRGDITQVVAEHFDVRDIVLHVDEARVRTRLSEALGELDPLRQRVLRLRFGFDGEPQTQAQIAQACGFQSSRAGQLVKDGLRKLRYRFRGALLRTVRGVQDENHRLREDVARLTAELERLQGTASSPEATAAPAIDPDLLEKFNCPVELLRLSLRTENSLRNADILFVGDLVQRSEAELLKTPNFGRQSLKEVREVLGEEGLSLGMDVKGWVPPDH